MKLRIGSRRSDLARVQALAVGRALKRAHPSLEIVHQFKESLGDKNLVDPLWKMPERGVFTEDFVDDLLQDRCDVVVHSWKDLPTEPRAETQIVATLPRADQRDLLLVRKDRWEAAQTKRRLKIYSSSPRREYNISPFLKEALPHGADGAFEYIDFESVRGNVPTRIEKLFTNDIDALVLAKAGLDRLLGAPEDEFASTQKQLRARLAQCRIMVMPLQVNPSAAAQGALALEIKKSRDDLAELFQPIHCQETFAAVLREREILSSYGGGCHQKIGVSVLKRAYGEILSLRGLTDAGEVLSRYELTGTLRAPAPENLSRVFPLKAADSSYFDREAIEVPYPVHENTGFWVSRSDALPSTWEKALIKDSRWIWTSGLETWKKLASRGIWVNGSSESRGELEDPALSELVQDSQGGSLRWIKLGHAESPEHETHPLLATYRLRLRDNRPNLKGKTHFYWMSGSSFRQALQDFPAEIDRGWHACGPGNTASQILSLIKDPDRLSIRLSLDAWLVSLSAKST